MQLARIIGRAISTVKHASFNGATLHVVQPLLHDRKTADGDPQIVIDMVSAGVGDLVMITSDGRLLRERLGSSTTPGRWSTVAIIDR
jgi:ethanolamine utilization protein EutN